MRKPLFVLPLILASAAACAHVSARADGRRLIVNEVPVIAFASSNRGLPGSTKAERWAKLLQDADGKNVRLEKRRSGVVILVGSTELTTVDSWEARSYGISPYALA